MLEPGAAAPRAGFTLLGLALEGLSEYLYAVCPWESGSRSEPRGRAGGAACPLQGPVGSLEDGTQTGLEAQTQDLPVQDLMTGTARTKPRSPEAPGRGVSTWPPFVWCFVFPWHLHPVASLDLKVTTANRRPLVKHTAPHQVGSHTAHMYFSVGWRR